MLSATAMRNLQTSSQSTQQLLLNCIQQVPQPCQHSRLVGYSSNDNDDDDDDNADDGHDDGDNVNGVVTM
eukprot:81972-Pyramimonas_sp.AAC.1